MLSVEILKNGNCFHYLMKVQGFIVIGMTYEFGFRVYTLFAPWPFGDTRTTSIIELKKWENEDCGRWHVSKASRVARHVTQPSGNDMKRGALKR